MEVKKWTFDAEGWGVRSGMGAYFLSRGLGETTQSFFDGETGFVLESDHAAAMKAKDEEIEFQRNRASALLGDQEPLVDEIDRLKDEIKRLKLALSDKTRELYIERNTPQSVVEVRLKDEIASLKESERKANALMREMQDEIKALKEPKDSGDWWFRYGAPSGLTATQANLAASSASASNVTISVDPREMCAEARHHMDRLIASLRG